ncbi:hypothetical protein QOZ91_002304 [Clostridium sardiniense]|nr:hypothetical protein [Clostridium sardiniense]
MFGAKLKLNFIKVKKYIGHLKEFDINDKSGRR